MNSSEHNLRGSEETANEIEGEDWKTVTKTKINRAKTQADRTPNKPVELSSKIDLDLNKDNVQKVKALVDRKVKSLIIIRGISGSGKSTLAR